MSTQSSTYYDRRTSTKRSSSFPVSPDWPDCEISYSQTQREDRPWWALLLSGRFTVGKVYVKAGMYVFVVKHNLLRTNEPGINSFLTVGLFQFCLDDFMLLQVIQVV